MLKKLLITGIVIAVLIPALWLGFPYYTARTVEITVTDKERVPDGDDGSYYLVFTEDEVFKNIDVLRRLKTTSSDLQGQLRVGKSFTVTVYGWRIPILSSYRNIVSIESEITPSMGTAASLPDLTQHVNRVKETQLPVAILFQESAHPNSLTDSLRAEFPELTIRVFGETNADLWGIMIYQDPSRGTILEATPLTLDGTESAVEWGPEKRGSG